MAEAITAPVQDSAATAFPEFEMPATVETAAAAVEAPAQPEVKQDPAPATAEPAAQAEEAKAEAEVPDQFKNLEKRFKDTQTALHNKTKETKQLEARLKKAADTLLAQVEAAGVSLTDEEQQLAYDDPAGLAKVYAEKLAAKKQEVQQALELTPEEAQEIENEHKEIEEKTREQEIEEGYQATKVKFPDIEQVISQENIDKYLTGADSKELQAIEGDEERFTAAYKKLKAYIEGVAVAKEKMAEGPKVPEGPSLSDAGSALPTDQSATISMESAWSSNKL